MDLPITDALEQAPPQVQNGMYQWLKWRTGRKVGRTIYAQIGKGPSDNDVLIGMMDSTVLALEAVEAHNAMLGAIQQQKETRGHQSRHTQA